MQYSLRPKANRLTAYVVLHGPPPPEPTMTIRTVSPGVMKIYTSRKIGYPGDPIVTQIWASPREMRNPVSAYMPREIARAMEEQRSAKGNSLLVRSMTT